MASIMVLITPPSIYFIEGSSDLGANSRHPPLLEIQKPAFGLGIVGFDEKASISATPQNRNALGFDLSHV
jgi:hypothetical protein